MSSLQVRTWIFGSGFSIIGFSRLNIVLSFPAKQSHCCLLLVFPSSMLGAAVPVPFSPSPFSATTDSHIKAYPQNMLFDSRNNSVKYFYNFQWAAQLANVWSKSTFEVFYLNEHEIMLYLEWERTLEGIWPSSLIFQISKWISTEVKAVTLHSSAFQMDIFKGKIKSLSTWKALANQYRWHNLFWEARSHVIKR